MAKEFTLSNGLEVRIYNGDGFDGDSSVQLHTPHALMGKRLRPLTRKDRQRLSSVIRQYCEAELKASFRVGKLIGLNSPLEVGHRPFYETHPDKLMYLAGQLAAGRYPKERS